MPYCRWALLAVLATPLAGCGTAQPSAVSKSATVLAAVQTYPEIKFDDATPTGTTNRRVVVQVRPHCVDGSHTLDCEGRYTLITQYGYRKGKPESLRCGQDPAGIGFYTDGVAQAVPAVSSGTIPVNCDDATRGELSLETSLPMADVRKGGPANGDRPPAAFQVTMRITVDQTGALRYQWQSRNGAHCAGQLATTTPRQTTTCRWP